MRPAPAPDSSPVSRTGDRPKSLARATAAHRKARARRMALEALEPRALMAVAPLAPFKDAQIPPDFTGVQPLRNTDVISDLPTGDQPTDGATSSPQVAVNRYNPDKLVAVWGAHQDPNANTANAYRLDGAFSNDGGRTWQPLGGLPQAGRDLSVPATFKLLDLAGKASVAFDGQDNVYVLTTQSTANVVQAGQVVLQKYDFSGNAPVAGARTVVTAWNRTAQNPTLRDVTAIRDISLAVDDNLPQFTDPATGRIQVDPGAGRVYVAWQDDVPPPQGYTGPYNPNTIALLTSTNGGASFSAAQPADEALGGHFTNTYGGYAPKLTISQGRAVAPGTTYSPANLGGQVTVLFSDFRGGQNAAPRVDSIFATRFLTPYSGAAGGPIVPGATTVGATSFVASTVALGGLGIPYASRAVAGITPVSASAPQGIGPGAVIASDNTLGSFSPNQSRLYVAYVDRADPVRYSVFMQDNPIFNSDILLRYSDDGGATWTLQGRRNQDGKNTGIINDDEGLADGFSGAYNVAGYGQSRIVTGRVQYQPQVAVDPATGTLAVSYLDGRYDPAGTRTITSVQISRDGGASFSPSVPADPQVSAYDQATQEVAALGPVPNNHVERNDTKGAADSGYAGTGDRSGLALYDGRLYAVFVTNLNGGTDGRRIGQVHATPMQYGTGPRVVGSTMGVVGRQEVAVGAGPAATTITFNDKFAADGTPLAEGFVVTFDRPIDRATFTAADVQVTYRDPQTAGGQPGVLVPVNDDPIPLDGGTTRFLVRFAPQSNVGTYSYQVGPDVRDLSRNTLATNFYYAAQNVANLPAVPPVGDGGSGVPAQDQAQSRVTVAGVPAGQGILDLDVLISLQHDRLSDLRISLVAPGGGPTILLAPRNSLRGRDLGDTAFDDDALRALSAGTGPYTNRFRPAPGASLAALNGRSPNGTWTLLIEDLAGSPLEPGGSGRLLSWGLKVVTSNRAFGGTFAQAGVAAGSPNVGGGGLGYGHLMDQDGDGIGGENPNAGGPGAPGSQVRGLAPGDVYAAPRPAPEGAAIFDGRNLNPPYDPTTLPLIIPGPHVVRSFVPGYATKTADNLVTDRTVAGFNVVFDRDMDPNSVEGEGRVVRVATPYGTFAPGDRLPDGSTLVLRVVRDPNSDPLNPGSDPDPTRPRTYQVQFFRRPAGATVPVPFPQTQSGTYSVTLAADVRSAAGDEADADLDAGLDQLRETPSAGNLPQAYTSAAAVPLSGQPAGTTYVSTIDVPDSFLVQNVIVQVNIDFPQDSLLRAELVAPDGTSVLLFDDLDPVGNDQNFTNTIFDDAAFTPISSGGPPFFIGPFNPQQPLAAFKGHFSRGQWQLRVTVQGSPVGVPGLTPQIRDFTLTLAQALSNSGVGEPVADQSTQAFRIFTFDPTNALAANSWTAVGPNGLGAKERGGNAEVAGRVGAIALDPSDPSGNTAFVAGASGGIWKTTNLLTPDPTGPVYTPLIDDASTYGLNIGSIAVFARNNDPGQSIIFAATGDASAAGDDEVRAKAGTQRGVGFLRSTDGGRTWTLLDSLNNALPYAQRDHFFASVRGQAGVTSYKIVADPVASANGEVILYAALSDLGANGELIVPNLTTGEVGAKGGLWRSLDTGRTWQRMRAGQATDVVLDLKSQNRDSGNLDFLYAAFRNDGVYFSPNGAQNFELMAGTVGSPLIQNADQPQPQPVGIFRANTVSVPISPNTQPPTNDRPLIPPTGRIVLAKPALTGDELTDQLYRGWLYAAVVGYNVADLVEGTPPQSARLGLWMTKDFGQSWTEVEEVALTATPQSVQALPEVPSNGTDTGIGGNVAIAGSGSKAQTNFFLGNFAISVAVDPNNANVVYLGGTDEFRPTGLIRIDTTGIHDGHAFYLDDSDASGALHTFTGGAINLVDPERGIYNTVPSSLDAIAQPQLNLIRDPSDPFVANATVLVHNLFLAPSPPNPIPAFNNSGGHVRWTQFDRAIAPDPYAAAGDPWSNPTRDVHQILTIVDPLTGGSRLLFATDQGVYTAVADADGALIGSIGRTRSPDAATTSVVTPATKVTDRADGDQRVVNGSRNGNLAIAQVYQGAAQPSQLAADLSAQRGFFYGNTQDAGIFQSDPDVINAGEAGYGSLSANVDAVNGPSQWASGTGGTVSRGTGRGLATQQTFSTSNGGTLYAYRISEDSVGIDGPAVAGETGPVEVGRNSTDTVRVNTVGKTFRLYQTAFPGNTPDAQWPFRQGYNLTVNPLSGDQLLISSEAGRIFATTNRGDIWSEIGNPSVLGNSEFRALTYGAPDPAPPGGGLGALNNFIFAGNEAGQIYVTFTAGGGSGNQWTPISGGLDGSPVRMIVTNPTRGSAEAYAVTEGGVYHLANARAGGSWQAVTGNLFAVLRGQFGDATLNATPTLKTISSIQADWRYLIPDDFGNPAGPTHPMLYVAGEGGVFRSYDDGATWTLFPDGAIRVDGTLNVGSLLNSPLGEGGGLPNAAVTDLDLALGNVDPATGRPDVATGPNVLYASTFGRGAFAIRLAPIVFPNTATNAAILRLSDTLPAGPPPGSDSGFSGSDSVTNNTQPVIEGTSEQSAFGNAVRVALFDVSDFTQAEIDNLLAGTPTRLPAAIPVVAGSDLTDSTGRFRVRVAPGYFRAFDPANPTAPNTDGAKRVLVQAVNGSGTRGNFAPLGRLQTNKFGVVGDAQLEDPTSYSFILDTTPPQSPGQPDLAAASDAGLSQSDNITNVTGGLSFNVRVLSAGPLNREPSTTRVYLVRDGDSKVVAEGFGVAGGGDITLVDPGPVLDGKHLYRAYEVDLAGNRGTFSAALEVTVDTKAPARPNPPVLDPASPPASPPGKPFAGSDSGVVGDNITNVNRPALAGSAEVGGFVQIIDAAGNVLGPGAPAVNVDPTNGRYSVQPVGTLADGKYALRVRETDVAGNLSLPSAPITVQILTRTPARPTLALVLADDSGTPGDNITNVPRPRLTGTGTPGLSVRLVLVSGAVRDAAGNPVAPGGTIAPAPGGQPIVVTDGGTFLVQFPTALADGTVAVRAVVSDVAGNSNQSDPLTLVLQGTGTPGGEPAPGPAAPTLFLLPADDSGTKGDNVTVARRPRFTGTARYEDGKVAAGQAVDLIATDGRVLAIATTSTTGAFTISLPNDLVNGKIGVQARLRSVSGTPGPASATVNLSIVSVAGDADGDGKADLDSFSRVTSRFALTSSASGADSGSAPFLTSALATDVPFQADFDGDGKLDYGFYRFSTAQWFVRQSRAGNALVQFGTPNQSLPVPADFDGDALADFATWNQANGQWTVFQSGTGTLRTASFGVPGLDQPIPHDFDGDGKADYAVYRPSTSQWFAAFSSGLPANAANNAFGPATAAIPVPSVAFGQPNIDVPVVADYDGDKKADVAVYRTTTGQWFINYARGNPDGSPRLQGIAFGQVGTDVPVPADYDGDGRDDFALFRGTNANWLILGSSSPGRITVSGSPNDVPLMAPLQPYRYRRATSSTRSLFAGTGDGAGAGIDSVAAPAPAPDLGRTAASFAAGKGAAATNAYKPAAPPRRRPAQLRPAQAPAVHRFGHPSEAALASLGRFRALRRRKDG